MLSIKILGPGCANCRKLEGITREVVAALGVEAELAKVTAINEILAYDVLRTPGLVIDERLVCSGRIPAPAAVAQWIREALESRRPASQ